MAFFTRQKMQMIERDAALPGRDTPIAVTATHTITGNPMVAPFPEGFGQLVVGMGCFWGAERIFWQIPGVWTTAVGYAGGYTPNPTYEEVCSGRTGHTEAVLVVFDPAKVTYEALLRTFWDNHDPTQGMRQGNDVGSQYRSAVYYRTDEEKALIEATATAYEPVLKAAGYGDITTEVASTTEFFYAEDYHQQYLDKNPNGYCGIGGTGVTCPVGLAGTES